MHYGHFTLEEREVIMKMKFTYSSASEIARVLGRHRSTIRRELARNSGKAYYSSDQAHRQACKRRASSKWPYRLEHGQLREYVISHLEAKWSPEQISHRVAKDYPCMVDMGVSHETIYRMIWEDKRAGGDLYRHLRQSHRKHKKRYGSREKRGQIKDRVSIDERPKVVDQRERYGDWESDTLEGKGARSYLVSCVERKSRYVVAGRINCKTPRALNRTTIQVFNPIHPEIRITMTVDNGKEFADFKRLEDRLGFKVYFAHPYHAWERGLNENTNGLLRQFFPKPFDFNKLTNEDIQWVVDSLNDRPRKCLNYQTPGEVLQKVLVALQI